MQVLVNGHLINYADQGRGRLIILLHGWGASLGTFDELTTRLAKNFRVVRIDFPGFGGSPKPGNSWGVGNYANLVAEIVAKLKLGDIYAIIGHSFGGRIIIKGIANGSFSAKKVVLIGTAGVKPPKSAKKSVYLSIAKLGKLATQMPGLKSLRPMLRKRLYSAAGASDYLSAGDMQQIFLNTINEDLLPLVHDIMQPTLLIWGENDQETPVHDAQMIRHELPEGQLVIIPGAGHFVYSDDIEAVMKALDSFL